MALAYMNGTTIYFEEHETGHQLVFVHGLGASHKMYTVEREVVNRTTADQRMNEVSTQERAEMLLRSVTAASFSFQRRGKHITPYWLSR